MNDSAQPYIVKIAYLPHDSRLPKIPSETDEAMFLGVMPECHEVILKARAIEEKFRTSMYRNSVMSYDLIDLNFSLRKVLVKLHITGSALANSYDFATSDDAIRSSLREESLDYFSGYSIYDRYFNVVRVANISSHQIIYQVAHTASMIAHELEFTLLGREEIAFIINAIAKMFEHYASSVSFNWDQNPSPLAILDAEIKRQSEWENAWADGSNSPDDWTNTVARYRWIMGHHLFNLCSIFCIDALNIARQQYERGNPGKGSEATKAASQFLRGTTATMWYASNMPGRVYSNYIRPSMINQETPDGFSGDQNADFNRVKFAISSLEKSVLEQFGSDRKDWPFEAREAIEEFVEANTLDGEGHTLIAAAMTGRDSSISQKQWQADLPEQMERLNAVDLLREITQQRRKAFGGAF